MLIRRILSILILIINIFLLFIFTKLNVEFVNTLFSDFNSETIQFQSIANNTGKLFGALLLYILNTILFGVSILLYFKHDQNNVTIEKLKNTFNHIFNIQIILFGIFIIIAFILGIVDLITGDQTSIFVLVGFTILGIILFFAFRWSKNKLFY